MTRLGGTCPFSRQAQAAFAAGDFSSCNLRREQGHHLSNPNGASLGVVRQARTKGKQTGVTPGGHTTVCFPTLIGWDHQ